MDSFHPWTALDGVRCLLTAGRSSIPNQMLLCIYMIVPLPIARTRMLFVTPVVVPNHTRTIKTTPLREIPRSMRETGSHLTAWHHTVNDPSSLFKP